LIKAVIQDIGYYLPPKVETNDYLVDEMGLSWTADDIFKKTGIKQRHVVEDECASDLGVSAAEELFNRNKGLREQIDYLIFCSQSSDYVLPATACVLQKTLGLSKYCAAIDINQGCSGFIYGLSLAKGLIESCVATNVLLITAETYTKYIQKMDKSTRTIFGDGATATWISSCNSEDEYIGSFVLGTDGRGAENLIVHNRGARIDREVEDNHLFMDGPEIFQFTLITIPKLVKNILAKENMTIDDIDYFVFHQANAFILKHLCTKLKVPKEKFCLDLENTGNIVSASIPLALQRAIERNEVKRGMKIMLVGFGVGYSWGGCIVKL